jgi:DNA-binding Lrp family transcriptional regulator
VKLTLDEIDRKILFEMEKGIPLAPEPFQAIADVIGITQQEVTSRIAKLQESGIIRRFGASIKPRMVGLSANALIAWKVPENRLHEVGNLLSTFKEVTHCYARKTIPEKWEYNLYTVLHARERETIEKLVKNFSDVIAINDYVILFSTREFKKTSTTTTMLTNQTPHKSSENLQGSRGTL